MERAFRGGVEPVRGEFLGRTQAERGSREILSPKDGWVVSWRCTTASVRAHLLHHLIRLALILSQSVHSSSRGSPPFLGSLRRRQLSEMNYSPHHLHFTACHLALLLLYYLKSPLLQSLAQPPPLLVCALPSGIGLWSPSLFQAMATILLLLPSQLDRGVSRSILCESPGCLL